MAHILSQRLLNADPRRMNERSQSGKTRWTRTLCHTEELGNVTNICRIAATESRSSCQSLKSSDQISKSFARRHNATP